MQYFQINSLVYRTTKTDRMCIIIQGGLAQSLSGPQVQNEDQRLLEQLSTRTFSSNCYLATLKQRHGCFERASMHTIYNSHKNSQQAGYLVSQATFLYSTTVLFFIWLLCYDLCNYFEQKFVQYVNSHFKYFLTRSTRHNYIHFKRSFYS